MQFLPVLYLIIATSFGGRAFHLQTLVVYYLFLSLLPSLRVELFQVILPISARKIIYFPKKMVRAILDS